MLKVLVTGSIGSGKTTFSRLLASSDWLYVAADGLVHELYAQNPEILDRISTALGTDIRQLDGNSVDTVKLAKLIFEDKANRSLVEGIVHPEVEKLLNQKIEESSAPVLVYENAVVRTMAATRGFDVVIRLDSSPRVRMSRLLAKGMSETDAEVRISLQSNEEIGLPDAWFVTNDGSIEDLTAIADACRERILVKTA